MNAKDSDVVETVTSETETWLKFRDETGILSRRNPFPQQRFRH